MKKRNLFNQVLAFSFDIRERMVRYKEQHPERVIGAMFLILLLAVTIFLISKATRKENYRESAGTLIKRISAPSPKRASEPATTDMFGLLNLYGKTRAINPDSLTLKDSLLLKEINKDLNKILNEKD